MAPTTDKSESPDRPLLDVAVEALRDAATRLGVKRTVREARQLPGRLLHPHRRRRLQQRIRELGPPSRVLFVCQGNIYRSPYAALAFKAAVPDALQESVYVESGGFVGPNRASPEPAINVAKRNGIDLRPHRSSLLTSDRIRQADLIVVVETTQKRAISNRYPDVADRIILLGDLDPEPIRTRTIRDPWNQSKFVLEDSYRRVDRCVRELAAACFHAAPVPAPPDGSDAASDAL